MTFGVNFPMAIKIIQLTYFLKLGNKVNFAIAQGLLVMNTYICPFAFEFGISNENIKE